MKGQGRREEQQMRLSGGGPFPITFSEFVMSSWSARPSKNGCWRLHAQATTQSKCRTRKIDELFSFSVLLSIRGLAQGLGMGMISTFPTVNQL